MGATFRFAGLPGPARLPALTTAVSSFWASVRLEPVSTPGLNVDEGFEAVSTYESIDETTPLLPYSESPLRYVLLMMALASLNAVADEGPVAVSQVLPQNWTCTVTLFMTDENGAVPMSVSAPN